MVDMDKKEQILHYHRIDGLSLREISRRVGLNRKTVTRYIREYEAQVSSAPEEGADMCLASRPKYPPRKVERSKLTDAVCAEIEYWLTENAKRRQTGMRKQCLKRQDIHRALIEKGFSISYSSVCKYIQQRKAEKRSKPKDVFIKQYYEPGEECEFDWGEVKLRIAGKQVTFTMAVFALCHSEGRWAYLFRHQDNLAFMESHRNFFYARKNWRSYTKRNLWAICIIDILIASLYNLDIYLEPINEYTDYLLIEIWIRPTITYGLVACFVTEAEELSTNES